MIVLDEFQFIARQEPEIGSLLNRFARDHGDDPNLLLCLSGSDVSFFEHSVVGYGAATYGRRTGSLRLQPFPWREIGAFAQGLAQEGRLRDTATYMSCLRAIAGGVTRLNQIAQRIGRSRSEEARPFLQALEEMGLVERRRPVTEAAGKKVSYAIADPFLRFWFRFVAPRESRLQTRADADRYLEEAVLPELDKFVSEDAFERVCQDWLLRSLDEAAEAGRWWGSIRRHEEGKRSRAYEADAVAVDSAGRVLALGSCKWPAPGSRRHEHGAAELDKLETIRAELGAPNAHLYFFDRLAFSPRLRKLEAERGDVHLVPVTQLD